MHITQHLSPISIFTYGSLMFAPVWQRIVSGHYVSCPAILTNYRRLAVKNEEYPVAIPTTGHHIQGVLYHAVHAQDVLHLDEFEGEYYERTPVTVCTDSNTIVAAYVYVLRPAFHHIAAEQAWDVDKFARGGGLESFMERYQGFH